MRKIFFVLALLLLVAGCQNKPAEVNNPESMDAVKQEAPRADEAPKADDAKKEDAKKEDAKDAPKADGAKKEEAPKADAQGDGSDKK